MKKFKTLSAKKEKEISNEIKSLLHAHRDCLRNQDKDTKVIRFDVRDGYYGEAFGIMRALALLGYGSIMGAVNLPQEKSNLRWWMSELEKEVLAEENFGGSNECDHCLQKWGRDGAGRKETIQSCLS